MNPKEEKCAKCDKKEDLVEDTNGELVCYDCWLASINSILSKVKGNVQRCLKMAS